MDRKIFKTGHSLAVTLSTKLLKELDLKAGDIVKVELDEGKSRLLISAAGRKSQMALNLHSRPRLGQFKI